MESNRANRQQAHAIHGAFTRPLSRTETFGAACIRRPGASAHSLVKDRIPSRERSPKSVVFSSVAASTRFSTLPREDSYPRRSARASNGGQTRPRFSRKSQSDRATLSISRGERLRGSAKLRTPHHTTRARRSFGKNPKPRNSIATSRCRPNRFWSAARMEASFSASHMTDKFQRNVHRLRTHPASAWACLLSGASRSDRGAPWRTFSGRSSATKSRIQLHSSDGKRK